MDGLAKKEKMEVAFLGSEKPSVVFCGKSVRNFCMYIFSADWRMGWKSKIENGSVGILDLYSDSPLVRLKYTSEKANRSPLT